MWELSSERFYGINFVIGSHKSDLCRESVFVVVDSDLDVNLKNTF